MNQILIVIKTVGILAWTDREKRKPPVC